MKISSGYIVAGGYFSGLYKKGAVYAQICNKNRQHMLHGIEF
ncbi:hypothetical protein HMPREF1987_01451 [Peptostreptococcaceae bacterium oral taxon 113 str. W5053]|nr:hypothetical protein HMPREF1987_01451 [Peptostreptococcaceae bacterium oral taxon 113 str. W5053]